VADELKDVLKKMLHEIEDLRASQIVIFAALSALPDFSTTKFEDLKTMALENNQAAYDELWKEIDGIS
jgi:hypothetical protein